MNLQLKQKIKLSLKYIPKLILIIITLLVLVAIYNVIKPIPAGISYESQEYSLNEQEIDFLHDLTYINGNNSKVYEQEIFNSILDIINNSNEFILIDMFLFNSDYANQRNFTGISKILEEKLIDKKKNNPDMQIYFITDEINNFYGSYKSEEITSLKNSGINVIITDLSKLRDSNPYYSAVWRTFFQWFGTEGSGTIKHPLGRDDKKVTIRSFLKLINTKANHRKVIVADNNNSLVSIVTSANPHSASSFHSNIGFIIKGDFGKEIIKSEKSVAKFSGFEIPELTKLSTITNPKLEGDVKLKLLTEGKIKENILNDINNLEKAEKIDLAMFYLSDRQIVKSLLKASKKGAEINIILDPNKDAFAREKNGIPNRQVAYELTKKSSGKIKIKWYDTKGEQFHTKLLIIEKLSGEIIIYGGSSNYTKRNLANLNLESVVRISSLKESNISKEVQDYFERIWENKEATYTLDFEAYKDTSKSKQLIYRFQEFSGFSSF